MRERLPHRRLQASQNFEHAGHAWSITCGFNRDGVVREIFLHGKRFGSQLAVAADDACVVLSYLLQHGATVTATLKAITTRSAAEIIEIIKPRDLPDLEALQAITLKQVALAHAIIVEADHGAEFQELGRAVASAEFLMDFKL